MRGKPNQWIWIGFVFLVAWAFCSGISLFKPDFRVDYGFPGALLPVLACFSPKRWQKLLSATLGILLLCFTFGGVQWWSLLALVPLALYNGERGNWRVSAFFYLYYPVHLVAIWGIWMLLVIF